MVPSMVWELGAQMGLKAWQGTLPVGARQRPPRPGGLEHIRTAGTQDLWLTVTLVRGSV